MKSLKIRVLLCFLPIGFGIISCSHDPIEVIVPEKPIEKDTLEKPNNNPPEIEPGSGGIPNDEESLEIGDPYQGGVVFYVDETGQHGLISALTDQSTHAEWCGSVDEISGADGSEIGTGKQNTEDIMNGCGSDGSAAALCANLSIEEIDDWYLPSKDELNEIYEHKALINAALEKHGGDPIANQTYWCSTELNLGSVSSAHTQNMENGTPGSLTKFGTAYVRAVRAF